MRTTETRIGPPKTEFINKFKHFVAYIFSEINIVAFLKSSDCSQQNVCDMIREAPASRLTPHLMCKQNDVITLCCKLYPKRFFSKIFSDGGFT